jgi:hypothetical protein
MRLAAIVLSLLCTAGCGSQSLGSPPASEVQTRCITGQTLVCTSRGPVRYGEDNPDYDHCRCEPTDRMSIY